MIIASLTCNEGFLIRHNLRDFSFTVAFCLLHKLHYLYKVFVFMWLGGWMINEYNYSHSSDRIRRSYSGKLNFRCMNFLFFFFKLCIVYLKFVFNVCWN